MPEPSPVVIQLRAAVSLYRVVAGTTQLEDAGAQSRGACPLHSDQPRGLYVDQTHKFYHCFSCGRRGDVVRWTMDWEQVDEAEAIARLSLRAGLS